MTTAATLNHVLPRTAPRVTIVLFLCIVFRLTHAGATSDPSDQFLQAYLFAQQAQRLERTGDLEGALRKYELALILLEDIYADYPTANPDRTPRRLREKVRSLRQQLHIPGGSLQSIATPNHALPRTAPRVTLSLGSFGVARASGE